MNACHTCLLVLILTWIAIRKCNGVHDYTPDWASLDKRPLPRWYDESKFGIFMHWGVYSVPSFTSEWFWEQWKTAHSVAVVKFMKRNYKPGFTYADFGPQFTAEFFDADKFANIIKSSGAKYVVLTSKHHEGYTMWPSNYSWNWNSMDVGPHRDLVGELREAILKVKDVHFGLYFSQFEWYNPLFIKDKENGYTTQEYVLSTSFPQMKEIVNLYHPEVIWSDGDAGNSSYWNSKEFLAWLYNQSPVRNTVVVNDRWGNGCACKHGGFYTCQDKYDPGKLLPHKWESCQTVDKYSWGFRRTMTLSSVESIQHLITSLVRVISCGGNLLLNVGPTHDGRIVPIFEERLSQLGQFLKTNGEAVYNTKPWIHQNDTITPNIWYTSRLRNDQDFLPSRFFNMQSEKNTIVYAFLLDWPNSNKVILGSTHPTSRTKITMLGYTGPIQYVLYKDRIVMDLSDVQWTRMPSMWAWVFKLEYLQSEATIPTFAVPQPELQREKKKERNVPIDISK